jgi:hypothetical protein
MTATASYAQDQGLLWAVAAPFEARLTHGWVAVGVR